MDHLPHEGCVATSQRCAVRTTTGSLPSASRMLAVGVICFLAVEHATAQDHSFVNIADTSGPFDFFGHPGTNDSGEVAFHAHYDDEAGEGVFKIANGKLITIADTSGPFNLFSKGLIAIPWLSINSAGAVVFGAGLDAGGNGIYVANPGEEPTVVAYIGDQFANFLDPNSIGFFPTINNGGKVAFYARLQGGGEGNFATTAGGGNTLIANTLGPFAFMGLSPHVNNASSVVIHALHDGFVEQGIYTGSGGGGVSPVVNNSGPLHFIGSTPAINDFGRVAFSAHLDAGGQGVFTIESGVITTIATTDGPLNSFLAPSINNLGDVVFQATLDSGGQGIFIGGDPTTDAIIQTGDALFGSTITSLGFIRGLNHNGDIGFRYTLANGISGIAVATVPGKPLPGDISGDGVVNVTDLLAVIQSWGACPTKGVCPADIAPSPNGDGVVNVADLLMVISNWG